MEITTSETGERIIAVGATGSHAMHEAIYVNTLPKLLNRIANTFTAKHLYIKIWNSFANIAM